MSKDSHFSEQPVYSQVLKLLDKEKILQISRETKGSEAYVKRFDGFQHLVVMLFGILKHFDSLRELEIGMKAEAHKLGHLGMNYLVRRSTLAEANICCPQEFFASVYAYLLEKYAKFLADSRPAKSYKGQTHEPKALHDGFHHNNALRQHTQRCRAAPEIRQEERRHESAYGNEVSCRRANGGAAHIRRKTRSLPAEGGTFAKRLHFGNGSWLRRHRTIPTSYRRRCVLHDQNEEKP